MRTIGIITLLLVAQAAWAYPDLTISSGDYAISGDINLNNLTVAPGASLSGPAGGTPSVYLYGNNSVIQGIVGTAGNGIDLWSMGSGTTTFSGAGQWLDRGTQWHTMFRGGVILDDSVTGFNLASRLPTIDELRLQNVTLIGSNEAATVETINNFVPNGSKISVQHGIGQTAELTINAPNSAYFTSLVEFNGLSDPSNRVRFASTWWGDASNGITNGIVRWGRVGMEYASLDSNGYVSAFSGVRGNNLLTAGAADNILLDSSSPTQTLTGDVTINSLKINGGVNIDLGAKNLQAGGYFSSQIIKTGAGESVISNGTLLAGGGNTPLFITNDSDLKITADINAVRVVKTGTGRLTLGGNLIGNAQYVKWYEGDLVLDTNSDVNFYLYDFVTTTSGKLTKNGSGKLTVDATGGWQNLSPDGMLIAGGRLVVNANYDQGNIGSGVVEFKNGAILEQWGTNASPMLMTSGTVVVPTNWCGAYLTGQVTINDMTKAGPNDLCLDGASTVNGALKVSEGRLIVRGTMNVVSGPITGTVTMMGQPGSLPGTMIIQTGAGHAFGPGSNIAQADWYYNSTIIDNNANGDTVLPQVTIGQNTPLTIQSNVANTTINNITTWNGTLVKTGTGGLTLNGTLTNLNEGNTEFYGGIGVIVSWNGGNLTIDSPSNVAMRGNITGNVNLTKGGSGTVYMNSMWSGAYIGGNRTGTTLVTGGTLDVYGWDADHNTLGSLVDVQNATLSMRGGMLAAPVRLSNASLIVSYSWDMGTAANVSLDVPAGKTGTVNTGVSTNVNMHSLTGSGTVVKTGVGFLRFSEGGSFNGDIAVREGTLTVDTTLGNTFPAAAKVVLQGGTFQTYTNGGTLTGLNIKGSGRISVMGTNDVEGTYQYYPPTYAAATIMPGTANAAGTINLLGGVNFATDGANYSKMIVNVLGSNGVAGSDYGVFNVVVPPSTVPNGTLTGLENLDLIVNIANGLNLKGQVLTVITTTSDLSGLLVHSATFGTKYTGTVTGVLGGLILSDIKFAAIPGDANHSGLVDQDDYKVWYDNYGTGTTWEQGNFKGSGVTDQDDYKTWYDNYGVGTAGGAVPEPATMALLALGGLAMLRRKK